MDFEFETQPRSRIRLLRDGCEFGQATGASPKIVMRRQAQQFQTTGDISFTPAMHFRDERVALIVCPEDFMCSCSRDPIRRSLR